MKRGYFLSIIVAFGLGLLIGGGLFGFYKARTALAPREGINFNNKEDCEAAIKGYESTFKCEKPKQVAPMRIAKNK